LYPIILKPAGDELEAFGQLESPLSQVANEIATNLSDGGYTLPKIAEKLGMSQRAIQRLLEKEGTTFRKLNEEIRKSAAERYLRSSNLPMKEIAYLLGFSELSTFSRAVKLWFGNPPRRVREMLINSRIPSQTPCSSEPPLANQVPKHERGVFEAFP
ncbi:MAG: helix-turn-helix transcriptional regulator, partial [Hyphomicrobiales bacterium]